MALCGYPFACQVFCPPNLCCNFDELPFYQSKNNCSRVIFSFLSSFFFFGKLFSCEFVMYSLLVTTGIHPFPCLADIDFSRLSLNNHQGFGSLLFQKNVCLSTILVINTSDLFI